MAKGGARAGAGRPPTDLLRVIASRQEGDGSVTELTVIDRVEETIRQGAMTKDAAARVGVSVETLRRWQATGVRIRAELTERDAAGQYKRPLSSLTAHERNCVDLANRMDRAEAEARTGLLALTRKLAQGGFERVERTERRDAAGNIIEVTEKRSTAEPNLQAITWTLSHRWRNDFGSRVEVTGADGGAVVVDAQPIADKVRQALAEVRENREASSPEALAAALAGGVNGNGTNGNGTNGHQP